MGLIYKTSAWSDSLWHDHVGQSNIAQVLMRDGMHRQAAFPEFAQDMHAALYLRHAPPFADDSPPWANELLSQAQDMPEYKTLKAMCNNNGFAAGIATETLLQEILPLLPQGEEKRTDDSPGASDGGLRQQVRKALRGAREAVTDAQSLIGPLCNATGQAQGSAPGQHETLEDVEQMRQAYHALKDAPAMRDIAMLAGRLKRITANKQRVSVKAGAGPIKGLEQGGDVARLLPSEIVGMRQGGIQRLQTLGRIVNRQALQYKMDATQPLGRGPIVICRDMSSSMRRGQRDTWAKAVTLAIMETATEQRRHFVQIAYEEHITQEVHVSPGSADLSTVLPILKQSPAGGTDFDKPLNRALELIHDAPTMRQADVVFITDGSATLSSETVEAYHKAQAVDGLSVYVVGVGSRPATRLDPIATQSWHVQPTTAGGLAISAAITLEEK